MSCYWGLIMTTSNLAYQLQALSSPLNDSHFVMNVIYTVNSVFCLTLFLITLRKPRRTYLGFIGQILTMFRNLIRLYDFEGTFDGSNIEYQM